MNNHSALKNNELISVLIPLYNHERYLQECLDSVLAQNLPNIEIILIDDGSKDKGFELASRWKDSYGHHFTRIEIARQANAGITTTIDRLVRKSSGNFLLLLASDDALLPGSIAERLEVVKRDGVMAVFGDAIPIDEVGSVLGCSAIGELGKPSAREALSDQRTVHWELVFRWNVYGSVLLCRREALLTSEGSSVLNLGLYAEDMQLYYRFSSQGVLRYLDKPVARYRVHSSSTSQAPENVGKLRKNVYQTRKYAMQGMPWLLRTVVALQAFTYHRWNNTLRSRLAFPLVACSYMAILAARIYYDFYRKSVLGQLPRI